MIEKSPIALQFTDVSFAYPTLQILENASFHFHQGEFIALVGPNGSGKTTLLKLILGLEEAQKGTITLMGGRVKAMRPVIGYVPQHATYDPSFPISVIEVVMMGLVDSTRRLKKQEIRNKAVEALKQVELEDLVDRPYSQLSGGQRRRVLVARALVSNPKMLILDEPTANMDKESEARLYSTLERLKGNTTILIVTHDTRFVSDLTDRVFCVDVQHEGSAGRTVVQHALENIEGEYQKRVRHDVEIPADFCAYPREMPS
ncbi:MAG: metal ABC transporter ATP-binding protein [Spirochaetales bacterium]|jgi:zinc transport system ATP-binding protein|nr:metal ABC transporter ATP-binding protein [Spirochaetales bacterium]